MGEQQGGRKKILVLDDEHSIVTYLETLLRDNGYDTVSAKDGREGMEKVRSETASSGPRTGMKRDASG